MHLDYWERLSHLGLISQQRRREQYQIIYVWKILEGLSNTVVAQQPIISCTNPRRGRLCFMPHMSRTWQFLTSIRQNNISFLGPRLFNIIPQDIRNLTNCGLELFKRKLDEFLLQLPGQPQSQDTPDSTTTACWMSSPHTKEHRVEPLAWPESLRPNKYKSTGVTEVMAV